MMIPIYDDIHVCGIFQVLFRLLDNLQVMCTQMIVYTDFVLEVV